MKHLALVEDDHFARLWFGRRAGPPWDAVDWDADPDWEWHSAAYDTPDQLMTMWRDAVGRSRAIVAEALAKGGLDQLGRFRNDEDPRPEYRGKSPSLRRILIDLIEEYARHVGHADLIRESIDGLVGEDPPH
ncbi:MAG: hypothetical protein QOH90_1310 [Actinomycetota bacterium]|nr:hypothetical protein [Actinomycetota bacterium]